MTVSAALSIPYDPSRMTYAFTHTKDKLWKRYGIHLTEDVWLAWHDAIRLRMDAAVYVRPDPPGEIWRVWIGARAVFVCVADDLIRTAIPVKTSLKAEAERAALARVVKSERTLDREARGKEQNLLENKWNQQELQRWMDDGGTVGAKYRRKKSASLLSYGE